MTKQRKNNPKTTEIQPKNNRPKQAMRMRMKMKMKKRNSLTGVKKARTSRASAAGSRQRRPPPRQRHILTKPAIPVETGGYHNALLT